MKLNRNYITPFLSLVFFVVGISGLFMFFHLLDGYTEVVHEVLGVFFIVCAIFHIILNWKALKVHFKKRVFLPALLSVLTLSGIIIISERMFPPVDLQIMNRIVRAPVKDAFNALNIDYYEAKKRLKTIGIAVDEAQYFEDLWKNTHADAEEVIDLILK
ncbi:DUF4405 domain-containing protein [Niabella digestorum]|uniref:DUF4405 domain-containing protein n=1 Tax=Niabella digestorum TaxID=3117701 RepID=A0ABU7RJ23_9BACT